MSQIFPKNKEKRPRTSSNETNTSFVKNVTSRVSGLLPSTITKWFSSPSSSNANGSSQIADASDSSTEDEASDTPVITQPPAKRMRFNNTPLYNHYGPAEASCSTNDVEIIEMPYSPFSGTQYEQPARNNFTTPLRPPNDNQDITERETTHMFKPPHTVSSIGQSIANKRKSIFDTSSKVESTKADAKSPSNTTRDSKHSSFKPSMLGSPFYPGRTMYGGASTSYINQPNIKQQTVAVVNESKSNDDTAISSSARRVMDLLESYSSPLMEARRIPLYTKPKNNEFNTSPDRPNNNKRFSYKTQELYVPSIASILQLKKKSRLMDTTNAARQIIASHSSASNYPAYPTPRKGKEPEKEQPNKMTTKVKSRLTRTIRGKQEELDVAPTLELPTAVLQIDQNKLPKFSFGTPGVSKQPPLTATSTPKSIFSTADKNIAKEPASKHETVTSNVFKFSNPVTVSCDSPQMPSKKFTFGRPEIDMKFENKSDGCSVVVGTVKEPEITTKSKDWQCSECWVKNKPNDNKCVCCGSKQPSQKAKCVVCKLADSQSQKDKCVNCEKSALLMTSPIRATSTVVSQSSKWKCEDCWVSNDDGAAKCACCGGSRPKKTNVQMNTAVTPTPATITWNSNKTTTNSDTTSQSTVPTKIEADWKCDDCWISNKSSVDKCAACGGARSGPKQITTANVPANATSFFGSTDNTFKTIIKSQKSDKWECTSCLVRNESCKDKCACCGAEKESKKKINDSKFNFGTTPNSSFKFGIDPKVQETSIAKPQVISTIEPNKPIAQSETNNNILAETPTFTFTLPAKKLESKSNDSKETSEPAPKMNFTFGIPKQTPTMITNKVLESNKHLGEEKLQEVPSVDLKLHIQEKPKPLENTSMFPVKHESKENTALTSKNLFNPLAADAKKDAASNPILTGSKTENPTPTFSFGLNPNPKVFDTTPKTTSSLNMFTQSIQTNTLPTTSATLSLPAEASTSTSLFQQPDMSTKPASLFQKSETTNSAATPTMFGFGNNGINNAAPPPVMSTVPTPEKPKFQFTFGSNIPKTESQSMFKPTFGSTESNTSSFSLAAGTTLGSGNALPTNTLGGSNGLSASNGLTGNVLPGNTLGALSGNPLTGNTLTIGNATSMTSTMGSSNGLSSNSLSGNTLQSGNLLTGNATGLFNNVMPKDNVWSTSNNTATPNLFVSNTTTSSLQKPATFTFGSTTPFNQPSNTPTFGNTAAPPQNIFGMGNQNNQGNTQPSMFSNLVQNQPAGNLFGSPQSASIPTPQMSMFGSPSIGATPAFGSQNPSIPTFDAPSLTPAPAPTFNFGASQSAGIFGFGQQQQQQLQQPQLQHQQSPAQAGVYSFGGAPAGGPQVQFTMGSNPAGRRVRKAVRRNPPR